MRTLNRATLKEYLAIGLVFVTLLSIFFFPVLFLDKILLGADTLFELPPWQSLAEPGFKASSTLASDTLDYYVALKNVFQKAKQEGILAWDNYIAGGKLTNISLLLLYPINFLFLLFPVEKALGYHAFFRLLISGLFTYLFARRIGLKVAAGLVAAIIQMFNGFMIVWLGWPHTYVMAVLPLNLWLLDKLLTKITLPRIIALSFTTFFLITAGFLPVAAYGFVLLALYALFRLGQDYYSGHDFDLLWRKGLACLGAATAGILLAAIQVSPLLEGLSRSGYATERAADTQLYRFYNFPLEHIITYLIPGYYGDNLNDGFWGVSNFIESTGYVGILPLFLALIGLIRAKPRGQVWFWSAILAVSTAVIYGFAPLQWLISHLPGFNILINTRLLSINALALAILAGMGMDALTEISLFKNGQKPKKIWLVTIGAGLILILLVVAIELYWYTIPGQFVDYGENGNPFGESIVVKNTIYLALLSWNILYLKKVVLFGLWLGLSLIVISLYLKKLISLHFFTIASISLIIADLFSFGIRFNAAVDRDYLFPKTPSVEMLQAEYRTSLFRILALERVFLGNTASIYGLQNVGGHSFLHSPRYINFLKRINPDVWNRRKHGTLLYFDQENSNLDSNLLNLLNVKYVLQGKEGCRVVGNRVDLSQTISALPAGEIWGEWEVGQTFRATQDNLSQICLFVATYQRVNDGLLIFRLKESPNAERDLVTEQVGTSQFLDNSWFSFSFSPVKNSANRTFYFSLESPTSYPGNAITVWASDQDVYPEGRMYYRKQVAEGDLTFITYITPKDIDSSRYTTIQNPDLTLYKNRDYLPMAYFASQAIILQNEQSILNKLESSEFDPYRQVILEEKPRWLAEPAENHHKDLKSTPVDILSYESDFVRLQIDAPENGFVILSNLYHPNWIASVGGEKSKIYRANYLFMAVQVLPGSHDLKFYFTRGKPGIEEYISLTTFIILISLSGFSLLRYRPQKNLSQGNSKGTN